VLTGQRAQFASRFTGPQRSPSSHLWDWWVRSTPAQRQAGRLWYPSAYECAERIAAVAPSGIGPIRAAAVLSALSPGTRWSIAERMAMEVAQARRPADIDHAVRAAYPRQREKVKRILAGTDPRAVLTGPKERTFWEAICGDHEAVVVDRWSARATGYNPERLTPTRWSEIADAHTNVAAWVHEAPRNFQAIVWTTIRGSAT
jgi:hypothetical protein